MRLRDRLFPEGTKTRIILRKTATFLKKCRPSNIKKVAKIYKENRI